MRSNILIGIAVLRRVVGGRVNVITGSCKTIARNQQRFRFGEVTPLPRNRKSVQDRTRVFPRQFLLPETFNTEGTNDGLR